MCPVLPPIPFHRSREEPCALVDPIETADCLRVGVKHHPVCSRHLNTYTVIGEALSRVEVKDEYETSPFEHNHLVGLVLE